MFIKILSLSKHFNIIIKCSKDVAGYDKKTDTFKSLSVILKLGQMIKQCCDLDKFYILKEDNKNTLELDRETTRNFKYMIVKWSFELSTNACKELYQKKWNKPALLPLASDIKLFRDYIVVVKRESYNALKLNPDNMSAFKAGEVQRVLQDTSLLMQKHNFHKKKLVMFCHQLNWN